MMAFNIDGLIALVQEGHVRPVWEGPYDITLRGDGLAFVLHKPQMGNLWRWRLWETVDERFNSAGVMLAGIRQRDLRRLARAVRSGEGVASKLITEKVDALVRERAAEVMRQLDRPTSAGTR